jgi:hypothetical protein
VPKVEDADRKIAGNVIRPIREVETPEDSLKTRPKITVSIFSRLFFRFSPNCIEAKQRVRPIIAVSSMFL